MRYVKIIDKYTIEDAPKNKDGIINYNFDTERLLLNILNIQDYIKNAIPKMNQIFMKILNI